MGAKNAKDAKGKGFSGLGLLCDLGDLCGSIFIRQRVRSEHS